MYIHLNSYLMEMLPKNNKFSLPHIFFLLSVQFHIKIVLVRVRGAISIAPSLTLSLTLVFLFYEVNFDNFNAYHRPPF